MRLFVLLPLVFLATTAFAHPGDKHIFMTRDEIIARKNLARDRVIAARECAGSISAFAQRRKAKRNMLRKRQQPQDQPPHHGQPGQPQPQSQFPPHPSAQPGRGQGFPHQPGHPHSSIVLANPSAGFSESVVATSTASAQSPHYSAIPENFTCVAAPDVTEGPYYINNELVRANLMEDQLGIPLVLDIGVIDVNTCEPLNDVFVEIWSANATGVYSSYVASLGGGGEGGSPPDGGAGPSGSDVPTGVPATDSAAPSGMPTGMPGGGAPGGMSSSVMVRNETFCRGGLPTNSEGIVELTTVYPGYYSGRTAHVHAMFHLNYEVNANGTLVSHAGTLLHIGQMFFAEEWNDRVFATEVYAANTNERTYNDEDSILEEESADGNNAFLDLELLGDDISEGILGYITIAVNSSASLSITNTNYLNSTGI